MTIYVHVPFFVEWLSNFLWFSCILWFNWFWTRHHIRLFLYCSKLITCICLKSWDDYEAAQRNKGQIAAYQPFLFYLQRLQPSSRSFVVAVQFLPCGVLSCQLPHHMKEPAQLPQIGGCPELNEGPNRNLSHADSQQVTARSWMLRVCCLSLLIRVLPRYSFGRTRRPF